MSKKEEKGIKIVLSLTVEADKLLREQNRRHGDMSRIVSELIIEKFGPKNICSVDPNIGQTTT